MKFLPRIRRRIGLAALVLFLCLPELALLGFFSAGALLVSPVGAPRPVNVVVVLGGAGDNRRYETGRDLVLAGYSRRLVLIEPDAAQLEDAQDKIPGVVVWADVLPPTRGANPRRPAPGWRLPAIDR